MKKRIMAAVLAVALTLSMFIYASAEQVTSTENGFVDISFSNGYHGFCIDRYLTGAYANDSFTVADDTSAATSNADNSDISQQLKILFTMFFTDFFVSDGNGGYVMDSDKADSDVAMAIYHFTGEQNYIWGTNKEYVNAVKAYTGPEIPDDGYTLTLENGDVITFHFAVMEPKNEGQQSFFAYKIEVNQEPAHSHEYGKEWESDGENHWHECECGDKKDVAPHDPTTADCKNPSVCEECKKQLSGTDSDNHTGETEVRNAKPATEFEDGYTGDIYCKDCDELLEKGETIPATHKHSYGTKWESDGTNHWHECACGEKKDVASHNGTTADCKNPSVCEECKKQLSGTDSDNHTGETEIKNAKPAKEFEAGYTGDTYCADCDELLEKGETIPATHKHSYGTKWESDGTNHWHECTCGDKKDIAPHDATTADCKNPSVCEECKKQLSGTDSDNHTGETEIKNAKPAKEFEAGYTGDTYCADCDELLEKGETIPATHKHSYGTNWESDGTNHWHECSCGDKKDTASHNGTTADCKNPSVCEECKKQLSGTNPNKHTGNTEIKNAKPATEFEDGYTGDIYCKDCDELLEKGNTIPATHEHSHSTKWESDGEKHWHECECGDKKDLTAHDGTTADCKNPSVCEECKKQLSGTNPNKHTGKTELKNAKPATEFENGYTGDTYCVDCGVLLQSGETIPATHKHSYSTEWKSDGTNHWHECSCGDKKDTAPHDGTTADCKTPSVCEDCGKQLSGTNPDKHTGKTEIKNEKPATEFEDGYTGDIYCADCDVLIEMGKVIEAGHVHEFGSNLVSNSSSHWLECSCGAKQNITVHTFVSGVCTECGEPKISTIIPGIGSGSDTTTTTTPNTNNTTTTKPASGSGSSNSGSGSSSSIGSGIGSFIESIFGTTSKQETTTAKPETENNTTANNNSSTNKPADSEGDASTYPDIPDTGAGENGAIAFAILMAALGIMAVTVSRKKRYTA